MWYSHTHLCSIEGVKIDQRSYFTSCSHLLSLHILIRCPLLTNYTSLTTIKTSSFVRRSYSSSGESAIYLESFESRASYSRQRKPFLDTTLAAIDSLGIGARVAAMRHGRRPCLVVKLPIAIPTSTGMPRKHATSKEKRLESRPGIQNDPPNRRGTFGFKGLKRKQLESNITPEAANEAQQTFDASRSPSLQSLRSSKHRRLEPNTPSTIIMNEAGPTTISNPLATSTNSTTLPLTHAPASPASPIISLDAEKQDNTTLWIPIPSSAYAVPLTLRSCMTVLSLFEAVFKICRLSDQAQQDAVLGLRTSLRVEWRSNEVNTKYLMVMKELDVTFEVFLRTIDKSPCWEQEDGNCCVIIEPVMD